MSFTRTSAVVAVISTGLIAGVFYAWICTTMWGLDTLPPETAIAAMNAMNDSVRNGLFFPVFFLTPVFLATAALFSYRSGSKVSALLFVAAAGVYVVGTLTPTALISVPMNRELLAVVMPEDTAAAEALWNEYSSNWQFWNILRTIGNVIAFAIGIFALMRL